MDQISVIIPVHNGESYLEKCIESIVGQDYEELEILIVNDGSADQTAAVCEKLAEKDGRVRVMTLPDLGVSAARNRGLEQARGAYIMFVDADDRLRPGVLGRLYEQLLATDSDMAGCGFVAWSSEEEWERLSEKPGTCAGTAEAFPVVTYDSDSYLKDALLKGNTRCWSKLYKRSLIGQVRFREGLTIGEDMLFLAELLPHIKQVSETAYPGYGYYQNPDGAMQRPFTQAYMDQIYCWEAVGELLAKRGDSLTPQLHAQTMVAIMLTVGKIALLSGRERKKAEKCLRECHGKLKTLAKERDSYVWLPAGYGIKVRMFAVLPKLYVILYHLQKHRKGK